MFTILVYAGMTVAILQNEYKYKRKKKNIFLVKYKTQSFVNVNISDIIPFVDPEISDRGGLECWGLVWCSLLHIVLFVVSVCLSIV